VRPLGDFQLKRCVQSARQEAAVYDAPVLAFSEFVSCDRTVSYADDPVASLEGVGSVNVRFAGQDFVLKNALFVPSLGSKLFSVSAAVSHGVSIQFTMETCRFSWSCGYRFCGLAVVRCSFSRIFCLGP
jgi:hypothetical protein